jgi:hypothetical protein
MSRTQGSGFGGGSLFYQMCPICGQKKAYYENFDQSREFKCTNKNCMQRFSSKDLIRKTYKSQIKQLKK